LKALHTPYISVIIPFFNVEQFLAETIESVLNQEYENWELILVDDGSTDGSTAIAKKYIDKWPLKIYYINHPGLINKGVCASRNLGIQNSKGDFIALLDADDLWTKEKLRNQVALLAKYPETSMFCEASLYWNSWNNSGNEDMVVNVGVPPERIYYPPQLALNLYPLVRRSAPCPSGILIKKEALDRIGGFEEAFRGEYAFYEDQAFLFKVYLKECIYVSSSCNNYYRLRSGSAMEAAKNNEHYKRVRYFFLKWAINHLKEKKIKHQEIEQLIAKALKPYRNIFLSKMYKKLRVLKNVFFKSKLESKKLL
jgi:glycosyltransferase involved in cell wall biosynthesis